MDVLEDYPWSSFPGYIGKVPAPAWLSTRYVLHTIGQRNRQERYKAFVEAGVNEELTRFYGGGKQGSVLGDHAFRDRHATPTEADPEAAELKALRTRPSAEVIITRVAQAYGLEPADLLISRRGRAATSPARSVAMYLCQEVGQMKLAAIAVHFGLAGYASAGASIRLVRQKIEAGGVGKELDLILQKLTP